MFYMQTPIKTTVNGLAAGCQVFKVKSSEFLQCELQCEELQWPKHLWNDKNMFETVVVRAIEC